MQPLLFLFPLYFFAHVDPRSLSRRAIGTFAALVAAVALFILVLMPGRIVLGPSLGYLTDFNYPYRALAEKIRGYCPEPDLILVDWSKNAGNIRFQFPDSLVLTPALGSMQPLPDMARATLAVVWDAQESAEPPPKLRAFLRDVIHIRPEELRVRQVRLPYRYSRDRFARFGIGLWSRAEE